MLPQLAPHRLDLGELARNRSDTTARARSSRICIILRANDLAGVCRVVPRPPWRPESAVSAELEPASATWSVPHFLPVPVDAAFAGGSPAPQRITESLQESRRGSAVGEAELVALGWRAASGDVAEDALARRRRSCSLGVSLGG